MMPVQNIFAARMGMTPPPAAAQPQPQPMQQQPLSNNAIANLPFIDKFKAIVQSRQMPRLAGFNGQPQMMPAQPQMPVQMPQQAMPQMPMPGNYLAQRLQGMRL